VFSCRAYHNKDHMPHGFHNGQKVKLSLRPLPPPEPLERPPWNDAFFKSQTLVQYRRDIPNRQIRDVKLETEIFRTGGNPELSSSFAINESLSLQKYTEDSIDRLSVPATEWHHVDLKSERSVYSKSAAAKAALSLGRLSKGFTSSTPYHPSSSMSRYTSSKK
jgi:hypothetical protein